MIGKTLSHYKITEELGRGGMGVVYKAEDLTLKRTVALKFLSPHLLADPDQKARFLHEAQAAAALEHPNISTIHEIHEEDGHTFMVMAYIEGDDLGSRIAAGQLSVSEALDITIQVAKGISKAHAAGIVHRDIKPGNVLITPDGTAKVVDFGLAKLATQTKLTKTGTTMGTVRYMSPEQARGDEVDHRTDIWSVGVMLYEMLAGALPFRGEAEQALFYSILNEDPSPVTETRTDVPVALEDIIGKALAKDTAKRYATMDELLAALETQRDKITLGIKEKQFTAWRRLKRRKRLGAGVAAAIVLVTAALLIQTFHTKSMAIDSVAVLPFADLSGDTLQAYYSDGVTEALIIELGKISALRVISRTSAMKFKNTDKTIPVIAEELNVDAIVEASVRRDGDQVTIVAKLIRAEPEQQMWGETYTRNEQKIESIHSEVAQAIAEHIGVAVTPEERERLKRIRAVDPEAYNAYLRGVHFYNASTIEKLRLSIDEFERAIEIDPEYAQAYQGLAQSWINLAQMDPAVTWHKGCEEAGVAVQKALALDDALADAYFSLGEIHMICDADFVAADKQFQRGMRLNQNSSIGHLLYGQFLKVVGRYQESLEHTLVAQRLDPLSPFIGANIVWSYFYLGRYDEALEAYNKTRELDPENPVTYWAGGWVYFGEHKYEDALVLLRRADALLDETPEIHSYVGYCLGRMGREHEAEEVLNDLISALDSGAAYPYHVAIVLAGLGRNEQALDWLEKDFEESTFPKVYLGMETAFDGLRSNPRFKALMDRLNFPTR